MTFCKPSPEAVFDELSKNGSVFAVSIYCYENVVALSRRSVECESVLQESKSQIEIILHRQMELTITKVILPRQSGEEIEKLLRIRTDLGVRYLEIWKQSVILE